MNYTIQNVALDSMHHTLQIDVLTNEWYLTQYYAAHAEEFAYLENTYPYSYALLAQIVEEVKQDADKTAERLVEEMMPFVTKDTTKEQLLQVLQNSYEQLMEKENRPQAVYAGRGSYRRSSEKIGRNDPCPCGSGKKYKQCCGKA